MPERCARNCTTLCSDVGLRMNRYRTVGPRLLISLLTLAGGAGACGSPAARDAGRSHAGGTDAGAVPVDATVSIACSIACDLSATQSLRSRGDACPSDLRSEGIRAGSEQVVECESDADCALSVDGRCYWAGPPQTVCTYHECLVSSDCVGPEVCVCGAGPLGQNKCFAPCDACSATDCRLSFGCGGPDSLSHGAWALACGTTEDECSSVDDCAIGQYCTRGPPLAADGPLEASFRCTEILCGW